LQDVSTPQCTSTAEQRTATWISELENRLQRCQPKRAAQITLRCLKLFEHIGIKCYIKKDENSDFMQVRTESSK